MARSDSEIPKGEQVNVYQDALCPLPGCGAILYITWHMTMPVFLDSTTEDLRQWRDTYTETWEIGCEEGHTVLLPLTGSNDYERFGDSDDDDEVPAEHKDLARLQALVGKK